MERHNENKINFLFINISNAKTCKNLNAIIIFYSFFGVKKFVQQPSQIQNSSIAAAEYQNNVVNTKSQHPHPHSSHNHELLWWCVWKPAVLFSVCYVKQTLGFFLWLKTALQNEPNHFCFLSTGRSSGSLTDSGTKHLERRTKQPKYYRHRRRLLWNSVFHFNLVVAGEGGWSFCRFFI